jgi:hypothetical protein
MSYSGDPHRAALRLQYSIGMHQEAQARTVGMGHTGDVDSQFADPVFKELPYLRIYQAEAASEIKCSRKPDDRKAVTDVLYFGLEWHAPHTNRTCFHSHQRIAQTTFCGSRLNVTMQPRRPTETLQVQDGPS